MAALFASQKEMFSKWLDESFREVGELGRGGAGEKGAENGL